MHCSSSSRYMNNTKLNKVDLSFHKWRNSDSCWHSFGCSVKYSRPISTSLIHQKHVCSSPHAIDLFQWLLFQKSKLKVSEEWEEKAGSSCTDSFFKRIAGFTTGVIVQNFVLSSYKGAIRQCSGLGTLLPQTK